MEEIKEILEGNKVGRIAKKLRKKEINHRENIGRIMQNEEKVKKKMEGKNVERVRKNTEGKQHLRKKKQGC